MRLHLNVYYKTIWFYLKNKEMKWKKASVCFDAQEEVNVLQPGMYALGSVKDIAFEGIETKADETFLKYVWKHLMPLFSVHKWIIF